MPVSLIVPLAIAGFAVFFVSLWCLICYALSHMSGWQTLARCYPAASAPQGVSEGIGVATLNRVQYKNTMFTRVTNEGLYLSQLFFFAVGHAPVLIPWRAFHALPEQKVLWATVHRFTISAGENTMQLETQNDGLAQTLRTWIASEAPPISYS